MIGLGKNTNSTDAYLVKEKYTKPIDYENIISIQMSRIASYRSEKNITKYYSSIDTLVMMLPNVLRKKAYDYKKSNNISYDISIKGLTKYDNYWEYVNELLESSNLIYRSSYIKTYE